MPVSDPPRERTHKSRQPTEGFPRWTTDAPLKPSVSADAILEGIAIVHMMHKRRVRYAFDPNLSPVRFAISPADP